MPKQPTTPPPFWRPEYAQLKPDQARFEVQQAARKAGRSTEEVAAAGRAAEAYVEAHGTHPQVVLARQLRESANRPAAEEAAPDPVAAPPDLPPPAEEAAPDPVAAPPDLPPPAEEAAPDPVAAPPDLPPPAEEAAGNQSDDAANNDATSADGAGAPVGPQQPWYRNLPVAQRLPDNGPFPESAPEAAELPPPLPLPPPIPAEVAPPTPAAATKDLPPPTDWGDPAGWDTPGDSARRVNWGLPAVQSAAQSGRANVPHITDRLAGLFPSLRRLNRRVDAFKALLFPSPKNQADRPGGKGKTWAELEAESEAALQQMFPGAAPSPATPAEQVDSPVPAPDASAAEPQPEIAVAPPPHPAIDRTFADAQPVAQWLTDAGEGPLGMRPATPDATPPATLPAPPPTPEPLPAPDDAAPTTDDSEEDADGGATEEHLRGDARPEGEWRPLRPARARRRRARAGQRTLPGPPPPPEQERELPSPGKNWWDFIERDAGGRFTDRTLPLPGEDAAGEKLPGAESEAADPVHAADDQDELIDALKDLTAAVSALRDAMAAGEQKSGGGADGNPRDWGDWGEDWGKPDGGESGGEGDKQARDLEDDDDV